jgi:hypothetical protein
VERDFIFLDASWPEEAVAAGLEFPPTGAIAAFLASNSNKKPRRAWPPRFLCRRASFSSLSQFSPRMSSKSNSGPMKRSLEASAPAPKKPHEEKLDEVSCCHAVPFHTAQHTRAHLNLTLTEGPCRVPPRAQKECQWCLFKTLPAKEKKQGRVCAKTSRTQPNPAVHCRALPCTAVHRCALAALAAREPPSILRPKV